MKYWFPYELFIAKRYLSAKRKTGFINLITWISILGVAIGVCALVIVLSVMNGFESEVRSRILGFDAHVRLRTFHDEGVENYPEIISKIRDIPHIIGLTPYILEKGLIQHENRTDGILIRGADPKTVGEVSDLPKNMVYGKLELGKTPDKNGKLLPGIVVGRYLAERLMLELGDRVVIFSPSGMHSILQVPQLQPFVVTGFFETGMYEYDNTYVYISIESAQKLFDLGSKVSGIEIRLDNLYKANEVVEEIENRLGFPYYPMTWFEMRKNLFSWMQLEKWAMFIVLSLIVMVAAFNIISTIVMVVMEKTREIGILKSIGATSRSVLRIFLFQGGVVGVLGTVIGLTVGYLLCWAQLKYKFFSLPPDVYFLNVLPVKMQWKDFLLTGTAGILICLLASIYPARKAASLTPVEAIRYE